MKSFAGSPKLGGEENGLTLCCKPSLDSDPSSSPVCRLQWPPVLEGSTCLGGQIVCPCSPVSLRHTCAPGFGHLGFSNLREVAVAAISSIQFPYRPPPPQFLPNERQILPTTVLLREN